MCGTRLNKKDFDKSYEIETNCLDTGDYQVL